MTTAEHALQQESVRILRELVKTWAEAKCPCRFPDWFLGCKLIGDDDSIREFGNSPGGKAMIEMYGEGMNP